MVEDFMQSLSLFVRNIPDLVFASDCSIFPLMLPFPLLVFGNPNPNLLELSNMDRIRNLILSGEYLVVGLNFARPGPPNLFCKATISVQRSVSRII